MDNKIRTDVSTLSVGTGSSVNPRKNHSKKENEYKITCSVAYKKLSDYKSRY